MGHDFCRELYNEVKAMVPRSIPLRTVWIFRATNAAHPETWGVHCGELYWWGQAHCSWDAKRKAIQEWFGSVA